MKCMVKPLEGFLVYLQHHKHVSINGGIFLAIKMCRAVIWYNIVKQRAIAIHLLCCKWGVCSIISEVRENIIDWMRFLFAPHLELFPFEECYHQRWIADEFFSNVHMKVILPQGMIKSPGVWVSRMQLNKSSQMLFFHNWPEQTLFNGCSSLIIHPGCMASVFVRVSCESPSQGADNCHFGSLLRV